VLKSPPGKGGEFYLTDAFQYMVDKGKKLFVSDVGGWYDCGKVDTLLETNEHLLRTSRGKKPAKLESGVRIQEPVRIEDGVTLKNSTIGPNVTIEAGSAIEGSTIANSILGRGVEVKNATVKGCVIGDKQKIEARDVQDSVMDAGELAAAR
jgi:glucose-1-phosphate thymidylyltransferase